MDFLFGDDLAPVVEPTLEDDVLILDYSKNKGDLKKAQKSVDMYSPDFEIKLIK